MQLTRPLTTMSSLRGRLVVPGRGAAARLSHLPGPQGSGRGRAAARRPTTRLENEHLAARARPGDRPDRAARAEGDRCRSRGAGGEARRRRRRPAATPGATASRAYDRGGRRVRVRRGDGCSRPARCARSSASRAATAPRRCARTTCSRGRRLRRRARRARLARAAEAAEAALPDLGRDGARRRSRRPTATSSVRAGGDEEPGQSWVDVSGARPRADRDQRREVRLRRAWRRHRHQRRAQPGVGLARPARARGGRRLRATWIRAGRPFSCGSSRTPATGATPDVVRRAAELNQPPFALIETYHAGPLAAARRPSPPTAAAPSSSPSSRAPRTARARSSCAPTSRPADRRRRRSSCRSCGRTIEAEFGAHEIKTFVVRRPASDVVETDLLEWRSLDGRTGSCRGWLGDEWRWHVEQAVGRARLAARARAGQRHRRPRGAPARCPTRTSERATAGSPSGCRSGPGSTAARVDGPGRDPVRGCRPRGDRVRRRRGGRAPRGCVHAVRGRGARRASTCSRSPCTPAPESEPQVGPDEPGARPQEPDGLRLGLLPAPDPPGDLAAGHARPARRSACRVVRLEDGVGTVELDGEVVLRVEEPRLWWPNGLGEQHLYEVARRTASASARSSSTADYALVVNGVRTPIKGWNWVPARRALRRAAAGEARAPARARRRVGREPRPRLGRRADRDDGVLRATATGSACSSGRSSASRAPGSRASRPTIPAFVATLAEDARADRAAAAPPSLARDLGRRQRARRRRLDARARRAARRRRTSSIPGGLAAELAARRTTATCTGRGSTRACASTTSTTTRAVATCTASSASRG